MAGAGSQNCKTRLGSKVSELCRKSWSPLTMETVMQSYTLPHDGGDRETCRAPGRSMSWWLIQKGSDWLPTIFAYFSITWHVLLFWSSESCCNICHTFCDLASSHGTMNQIWLRLFPVSWRYGLVLRENCHGRAHHALPTGCMCGADKADW